MLTPAQIAEFKSQGYLRGAKVLSDAEVEELRAEIQRVIDQRERKDIPQPVLCHNFTYNEAAPVWQIVNIWEASPAYARLIRQPVIGEEIAQLTGATALRIWHDQIQYKPATTGGVNMWHQDAPLWPIIAPMTEVTAALHKVMNAYADHDVGKKAAVAVLKEVGKAGAVKDVKPDLYKTVIDACEVAAKKATAAPAAAPTAATEFDAAPPISDDDTAVDTDPPEHTGGGVDAEASGEDV